MRCRIRVKQLRQIFRIIDFQAFVKSFSPNAVSDAMAFFAIVWNPLLFRS